MSYGLRSQGNPEFTDLDDAKLNQERLDQEHQLGADGRF